MIDPSLSIETQAEAFARGLGAGLVSPRRVVAWIDDLIRAQDDPDITLLEASLCERDRHDLIKALHRISSRPRTPAVARLIFGQMLEELRRDPRHAEGIAAELYRMVLEEDFPHPDAENEMWGFDDAFDLARRGYFGDRAALVRELEGFLRKFSSAP